MLPRPIIHLLAASTLALAASAQSKPSPNADLPDHIAAKAEGRDGLILIADPEAADKNGIPLYLINRGDKTEVIQTQDGDPFIKLYRRNIDKWERAQPHWFSDCGTSYLQFRSPIWGALIGRQLGKEVIRKLYITQPPAPDRLEVLVRLLDREKYPELGRLSKEERSMWGEEIKAAPLVACRKLDFHLSRFPKQKYTIERLAPAIRELLESEINKSVTAGKDFEIANTGSLPSVMLFYEQLEKEFDTEFWRQLEGHRGYVGVQLDRDGKIIAERRYPLRELALQILKKHGHTVPE